MTRHLRFRACRGLAAVAVASSLALAACGEGGGTDAAPDDEGVTTSVTADPAPRTIEGAFGGVELEGTFERVVATGNYESDIALALGVRPVVMGQWLDVPDGAPDWRRPLLDEMGGDYPEAFPFNPDGYDVEQTLAMEPDLVLDGFLQEDEYDQLSEVVPTISLPYELDTREYTLRIGQALGLEDEARALIQDIDAQVAESAREHPEFEGTEVAYGFAAEDGTILDYGDSTTLSLLTQLGFTPSERLEEVEDFSALGPERYGAFDADLLIVSFPSEEVQASFESNDLFAEIPAVEDGRYWGINDPDTSELLRSFSPPQISYALENFVPTLAEYVS